MIVLPLAVIVALLAVPDALNAKDYYVNDESVTDDVYCTAPGRQENKGTGPDSPKHTVRALLACTTLGPSDRVLVDTGRYVLESRIHVRLSGEKTRPIEFVGSPKGTVLVRNSTAPPKLHNCHFCVEASRHIVVRGFITEGGHASILVCRGSRNVVVRDNVVQKGDRADYGIALMGNVSGCVVANNIVTDRATGIQVTSTDPFAGRFAGRCEGNIIWHNVVFSCSDGIGLESSPGTRIEGNAVHQCPRAAVKFGKGDKPSDQCEIRNNVLQAAGTQACAVRIAAGAQKGLASDRNFFLLDGGAVVGRWEGRPCPTLASWQKLSGLDVHSACIGAPRLRRRKTPGPPGGGFPDVPVPTPRVGEPAGAGSDPPEATTPAGAGDLERNHGARKTEDTVARIEAGLIEAAFRRFWTASVARRLAMLERHLDIARLFRAYTWQDLPTRYLRSYAAPEKIERADETARRRTGGVPWGPAVPPRCL